MPQQRRIDLAIPHLVPHPALQAGHVDPQARQREQRLRRRDVLAVVVPLALDAVQRGEAEARLARRVVLEQPLELGAAQGREERAEGFGVLEPEGLDAEVGAVAVADADPEAAVEELGFLPGEGAQLMRFRVVVGVDLTGAKLVVDGAGEVRGG